MIKGYIYAIVDKQNKEFVYIGKSLKPWLRIDMYKALLGNHKPFEKYKWGVEYEMRILKTVPLKFTEGKNPLYDPILNLSERIYIEYYSYIYPLRNKTYNPKAVKRKNFSKRFYC